MNERPIAVVLVLGAIVVFGGLWMFLPSLEAGEVTAARTASTHVERARRILHNHSPVVRHAELRRVELATLSEDLDSEGVAGVDAERFREEYDAIAGLFDLRGGPPQPGDAIREWGSLSVRNDGTLGQALSEVNQALAAAPQHAEALRLKAVVQYHEGLSESARASLIRTRSEALRQTLGGLMREALELARQAESDIEATLATQIAALDVRRQELTAESEEVGARLAEVERTIAELESKKAQAEAAAATARNAMDALRDRGVDLSDPKGSAVYAEQYLALARQYDEAFRTAHLAEQGDYPAAEIDRSGDYIRGRYLENGSPENLTVRQGLVHYRDARAVASARLDGLRSAISNLEADKARLAAEKSAHAAEARRAKDRIAAIGQEAAGLWQDLRDVAAEAEGIEDTALDRLDQSARAASQSASAASTWVRDARSRQDAVSESAKDRSPFKMRLDDRWMEGYAKAVEADAHLAAAWIHYARFEADRRDASLLALAGDTLSLPAKEAEQTALADESRAAGMAAVTAAMTALQAAHGASGQHWTIVAQGAGVEYLLALFGDEARVPDVIETYRTALQGRENESFAAPLAARLKFLESR